MSSCRRRKPRFWREWSSGVFCFFPSRRRHTRYWRDWSSDVCSSDLNGPRPALTDPTVLMLVVSGGMLGVGSVRAGRVPLAAGRVKAWGSERFGVDGDGDVHEIGRASCRERGEISVVAAALKTEPTRP